MPPARRVGAASRQRVAIVGDFLPPTVADQVLIDAAFAWSRQVQVLILAGEDDPIGVARRVERLRAMAPRASLVTVPVSRGRPDAPEVLAVVGAWIASSAAARPDALVGPGLRDLPLARALGLDYLPVDVSGVSEVSDDEAPRRRLAHWDAARAAARARAVRRVVVMGPESTGKTTLAGDLARHFGTVWASEYLRLYLDAKGAVCEPADLPRVIAGHVATETALARHARRVLFCDTDPLMTAVYSRFYYGELPAWLDEAAAWRRADHYLLLDCDVPWVPDAQRDAPHAREVIRDLCREELARRQLPFTLVGGTWDRRRAMAIGVVDRLLGTSRTGRRR